ncbi:hypothetical protein [Saccharothrix obliqua]|uniref:hypothetical protein n=1 Tax=Saccharothrix obliqua TaxID=2861747 RepID=UPI001C5FE140|nr:hypothetical protein [Saccharothrix obliqua]MBW4718827.1 hypothetical protein [Saccharothrix obliqua]
MRSFINRKRTVRTLAAVAMAVGALSITAGPAAAAGGPATLDTACVATDISLDPAARTASWSVDCTSRRYVHADVTVFAGGVAHSSPSEGQWVNGGDTWTDVNVYPQTTPAIDHLCVHLVSFVNPSDPFDQPELVGHSCV